MMASTTISEFAHLRIPLDDIQKATNNFHQDNIIGHGDFGTAYKGQLLWSGKSIMIVARRLDYHRRGLGSVGFLTELSVLSGLNHPNLVSIIGFCDEKSVKIIVTTYAANGSLGQYLDNPNLTWTQRLRICVDVARALSYLHSGEGRGYGVIHRLINSSTILLDENWEPKLSGFEISMKQSVHRMDQAIADYPIGTIGYMDPSVVKTKGVTYKSDIYSFGVVLLELLCGRKAFIRNETNMFLDSLAKYHYDNKTLHDVIYPDLWMHMSPKSLVMYSKVAYSCLEEPAYRPNMDYVVDELKKALEAQMRCDNLVNNSELLKFPFTDIKLATSNFSDVCRIAYTTRDILYRGELSHSGKGNPSSIEGKNNGEPPKIENTVTIKRMNTKYAEDVAEVEDCFFTEIEMLISVKHRNIITILGFCVEKNELILVTDNLSNGYLGHYLRYDNNDKRCALTWEKRLKICIGVAKALNYLHYDMEEKKVIINCGIQSDNIGLGDDWEAKIVDFGRSVFLPPTQADEGLRLSVYRGNPWYMDPDFEMTYMLKRESDVYSFGIVLFEILCGRRADHTSYIHESDAYEARRRLGSSGTIEDMIDPLIKEETHTNNLIINRGPNKVSIETFIKIASQCVAPTQDKRPPMHVVVTELERALSFQENPVQHPNIDEHPDGHEVVNELETTLAPQLTPQLTTNENILAKNLEHLRIRLRDIMKATFGFSHTFRIAVGNYYSLYEVLLSDFDEKHDGLVESGLGFIKRISSGKGYGKEEFYREIQLLTSVKHPNIVNLLGFYADNSEMVLLFDGIYRGKLLDDYMTDDNRRILTWGKRLKICIDVARALAYLHYEMENQMMVINRFICGSSIVIGQNREAQIIDFGYAVFQPSISEDEALFPKYITGTKYTIDPEYENSGKLKRESDVYSFGVLAFQILCGRHPGDPIYLKESDKGLAHVARLAFRTEKLEDIIDPIIKGENAENSFVLNKGPNKKSFRTFSTIAYQCLVETQDQRPTMKDVVRELEKALSLQENSKDNPIIPLEVIRVATKDFKDCIGKGGFGKVYLGELQDGDGSRSIVAKKLNKESDQGEPQFLTELQILLEYKHENVIGLEGYCNEEGEKIIVYEYASRGSLDRYLKDPSLTWVNRLNICVDVARALDFLHGGVGKQAKVIHRDIKTENILLNNDWKAKLADFGLSLISPLSKKDDYIIDHWCGTPGYVDPIYKEKRFLTTESDIYSFGVVLFEILCGQSTFAIHEREGQYLPDFIENKFREGKHKDVVFKKIREQIEPKSLSTFQTIALQCLHQERVKRPTAKQVLMELKNALEFQLNSEVKSDYVEETPAVGLSGELNNMTMTADECRDSEIHNEEKMLPDHTSDSADQSVCCWPCGFRKVKTPKKTA